MARRRYGKRKGMLSENMSAQANMPQEVKMFRYSKTGYMMYDLNDTISGIDNQMNADVGIAKRYKAKSKY